MIRILVFVLGFFLSISVFAESSLSFLLAPALIGVTSRRLDTDYAKTLKIDPRGTVYVGNAKGNGACTGRMLNPTTLMLAAHCLELEEGSDGILNIEGVNSLRYFIPSAYPKDESADIAVVVFPEGTGEFLKIRSYAGLTETPMDKGKAYLIGYGIEDEDADRRTNGAGVKGWGEQEIVDRKGGFLVSEHNLPSARERKAEEAVGSKVAGLSGDSGSSAFNEKGEVVGVLVTRYLEGEQKTVQVPVTFFGFPTGKFREVTIIEKVTGITNQFIDVTGKMAQDLFRDAIVCKSAPCAGNFKGSGVKEEESRPILTKSKTPVPTEPFDHRTLRIGRYHSMEEGQPDLYVHTVYGSDSKITTTDLFVIKGNDVSARVTLTCEGKFCRGYHSGVALAIDNDDTFKVKGLKSQELVRYSYVWEE